MSPRFTLETGLAVMVFWACCRVNTFQRVRRPWLANTLVVRTGNARSMWHQARCRQFSCTASEHVTMDRWLHTCNDGLPLISYYQDVFYTWYIPGPHGSSHMVFTHNGGCFLPMTLLLYPASSDRSFSKARSPPIQIDPPRDTGPENRYSYQYDPSLFRGNIA